MNLKLQRLFRRFAEFLVHHPWLVLALLVASVGAALPFTPGLKFDFSPQAIYRGDDEMVGYSEEFKRTFGYDEAVVLVVLEATGGLMEVLSAVLAYPAAVVAVDAPQSLNAGLMASADYRARLAPPPAPGRWAGYKVCEYLLRQHGIGLYATPADEAAAPS